MVEGPGCKLKGEKLKPRIQGKKVLTVSGNAVDRHTKKKKRKNKEDPAENITHSPYHDMIGKTCTDIQTLGKEFFVFFKGISNCLRVHFLMAGGFRVNGQKIDGDGGGEAETASLVLEMEGDMFITFNKCSADMRSAAMCLQKRENLKCLDICDDAFSQRKAIEVIQGQGHRQVCDLLLDQDILPGVGNIIKNEALFDSGINPHSKVSELTVEHISHLVKMTRDFSMIFYKCRRDGKSLNPYLKCYRKAKCGQCGGKITNTRLGDDSERLTSFCITCQVNDLAKIRSRNLPMKNSLLGWVSSGPSENDEWTCEICTLINKALSLKCLACMTPKPSSRGTSASLPNILKSNNVPTTKPEVKLPNALLANETNDCCPPSKRQRLSYSSKEELTPLKLHPTLNSIKNAAAPNPASFKPSQKPALAPNQTDQNNSNTQNVFLPTCDKHKLKCLMREVRKEGPNLKRFFFACPSRQCNFFKWADENFPLCEGHGKRCVLRVTLKQGPNNGRRFHACSLEKRKKPCQFFQWADQYNDINIR